MINFLEVQIKQETEIGLPQGRQPIAVSDISIYICLIDIRSKSKEQLNERRAGLSNIGPMHCNEWRPSNENFVQSTIF